MDIDAYLSETGQTAQWLASQIGLTTASLSRIRQGKQNLSRDTIRRIFEVTKGRVSLESLVLGQQRDKPANAAPDQTTPDQTTPADRTVICAVCEVDFSSAVTKCCTAADCPRPRGQANHAADCPRPRGQANHAADCPRAAQGQQREAA